MEEDSPVHLKLHPDDFNGETPIYKKHFSRLGIQNRILGIIFQARNNNKEGMRICLKTGIRIDFTCFCRCDKFAPLLQQGKTTIVEGKKQYGEHCKGWDLEKADSFWFTAILALGKLMRKDYLISSHLAHMLIMEGLVAQMIMRDNQYNTNFHRYGYADKLEYLTVDVAGADEFKKSNDVTYNYIAEQLYRAVISYDELVLQLNNQYISRCDIFLEIWRSYLE